VNDAVRAEQVAAMNRVHEVVLSVDEPAATTAELRFPEPAPGQPGREILLELPGPPAIYRQVTTLISGSERAASHERDSLEHG